MTPANGERKCTSLLGPQFENVPLFAREDLAVGNQANGESTQKNRVNFNLDVNPKVGDSLQGGFDALQKVFVGLVESVKEAVGPETLKSLELGNWFEQLASCLDQIATSLREAGTVPAEKVGELAFFSEQLDSEIRGSKFESQQASLRQRLDAVTQSLDDVNGANATEAARKLAQAAGYFHAAAKTVAPLRFSNESKS